MKLTVLFLTYPNDKYPNALTYLKHYLKKIKNHDVEIIVINNQETAHTFHPDIYNKKISDNITYIDGDNSIHEFSGWNKGLQYLNDSNNDFSSVLFVNDAFLAPSGYDSPLTIINDTNVYECRKNNKIIGNILNAEPYEMIINDLKIEKYMRTHCFMLSRKIIEKLEYQLPILDNEFINKCISLEITYPYMLLNAPINSVAKNNITRNLQIHWHSFFRPETNWDLFRVKSLLLLNELYLYTKILEKIK